MSVLPDPLVPCRVNFYEFRPGIPPPPFTPARIRANWPPIHGEIQLAAANRPPIPAELTRVKATERRGKWKRRKGRGGIIAPREKEFSKTIPLVFRYRRDSNCEKFVCSKNRNIDILLFFFSGFSKFSFDCLGIFVRKYTLDWRIL